MLGMDPITNADNYIDMREVSARIDTLEGYVEDTDLIRRYAEGEAFSDLPWADDDCLDEDEIDELLALRALSEEMGATLDETLIRESAFEDYATQTADDIYGLDGTGASAYFDYDKFADEYQQDFSTVEFDGVTYYYR